MSELTCPYCDEEIGRPEDCYEPGDYEHKCPECEKSFMFELEYEPYYYSRKADCLNGEKHSYKKMNGDPAKYYVNRYKCWDCGHETRIEDVKELES